MFSMLILFLAFIYNQGIQVSEGSCEFPADLQGTWQSRVQSQQLDRGVWIIDGGKLQGIKINNIEKNLTCYTEFNDATYHAYILEENKIEMIFGGKFRIFVCIEMQISDGELQYKMRTDFNWYTNDFAAVCAVPLDENSKNAICNSKDVEQGILSRMSTRSVQRGSSNGMLRRLLDDEFRKFIKEKKGTL